MEELMDETYRLINPSTRHNNIHTRTSKLVFCNLKHSFQFIPFADICSLEDCSAECFVFGRCVLSDGLFCFWAEREVCEEDVAAS